MALSKGFSDTWAKVVIDNGNGTYKNVKGREFNKDGRSGCALVSDDSLRSLANSKFQCIRCGQYCNKGDTTYGSPNYLGYLEVVKVNYTCTNCNIKMFGCGRCFDFDKSMIRLKLGLVTTTKDNADQYEQKLKDYNISYYKSKGFGNCVVFDLVTRYVPTYTLEEFPTHPPSISSLACGVCDK